MSSLRSFSAALSVLSFVAGVARAQSVSVGATPAASGRVAGVVYDSTARRPLPNALLQWVRADAAEDVRNVQSDARGRFTLDSLVPGLWQVQIAHPRADSLGLSTLTRGVRVKGRGTTNAEVALPSLFGTLRLLCGIELAGDTLGMLHGTVQPARVGDPPASGGTVSIYWRTYRQSVIGPLQELRSTEARIDASGQFAACGLPPATPLELVATRGTDSTGVLDLELPRDRIGRLDLLVGDSRLAPRIIPRPDSSADTLFVLGGDGRVRGTVVGPTGQPLANARIRMRETGLDVRTRGDGSFVGAGLPLGSHQLEVAAIGARPQQIIVNLAPHLEPEVRVTVDRVQTLDTLRVKAMAVSDPNLMRDLIGFEQRRLTGLGAFMDLEAIRAKHPRRFEDVLTGRFDTFLSYQFSKEFPIMIRAWEVVGSRGFCRPDVFIDGVRLRVVDGEFQQGFLNGFRGVEHVVAVEIYEKPWMAPAEFQYQVPPGSRSTARCGSIVFWTSQRVPPETP